MERRNLKGERIKAGYTSKEFCKKIGISQPMLSVIENGTRNGSYDTWVKIQEALNLENSEMWDLYLKQD